MRKNDEFTLKNDEYDDNARAVKESELLPIYEAMNFSGDIQPLDDIEIAEPQRVDYQQKKRSDSKGADTKKDKKIFNLPVFSDKKTARVIVIALIALFVIGAAGSGVYFSVNSRGNAVPVKSVYDSDGKTYVMLSDGNSYEMTNALDIKVSDDGSRAYFCKNTSSKTGTYDIKLIDTARKKSLSRGGTIVCVGAGESWQINSDGTLLSYSKKDSGVTKHYLYSAAEGKSVEISTDIEEIFLPSKGDVVYYTRRANSVYSLHRIKYGEEPSKIASEAENIEFYDSEEGSEILYTLPSGDNGEVDVFSVKGLESPRKICLGVTEAYLDKYEYGGNLYYFTKKRSAVNWQDFINDKYQETDSLMKEPVENDFMVEYGFIVKRYILNESAFAAAKKQYNAKLKRDLIREALNKLDLGMEIGGTYDCSVYNRSYNCTLVSGVTLENILAYSVKGLPRVVFRKSVINVDNKISMEELVARTAGDDTSAALDYVRNNVGKSFSISNDCIYSWYDGNKTLQYTFNDYKDPKTVFYTATDTAVYGLSGGKLYCNSVSTAEFGKAKKIAENISDCSLEGNFVYYHKLRGEDNLGLYRYSRETGEQYLGDNVASFTAVDNDRVIIFSMSAGSENIVDISFFDGKDIKPVDKNIPKDKYICNENTVSYIKIPADAQENSSGDMYIWTFGGEPTEAAKNVSSVKYVQSCNVSK